MTDRKLKLYYFPIPGRSVVPCVMSWAAGLDLEFVKVSWEEWGKVSGDKARFPLGTIPVLEVIEGGKSSVICETIVLNTYLAKLCGMWPEDRVEAALVNEIMADVEVFFHGGPMWEGDVNLSDTFQMEEDAKKAAREGPILKRINYYFGRMDSLCAKLSPQFNVADFILMSMKQMFTSGFLDYVDKNILDRFSTLQCRVNALVADPKVSAAQKRLNNHFIEYKLTYFPIPGRVAASYVMCAYGGLDFEFEKISQEEWAKVHADRERFPNGTLPVLAISAGGSTTVVSETAVIEEYLAEASGLWPKDLMEQTVVHEIMADMELLLTGGAMFEGDVSLVKVMYQLGSEDAKKEACKEGGPVPKRMRFYMGRIDDLCARLGRKVYVSDMKLMNWVQRMECGKFMEHVDKCLMNEFKHVQARVALAKADEKLVSCFATCYKQFE
jgi:glutathione S-transferase